VYSAVLTRLYEKRTDTRPRLILHGHLLNGRAKIHTITLRLG